MFRLIHIFVSAFVFVSAQAAAAAECGTKAELLQFGDSEMLVLQTMDAKPVKLTRTNIAGVLQTAYVWESGNTTCTVVMLFGRLVSKSVDQETGGLFGFQRLFGNR